MKKDGKYRYSLQFGSDSAEEVRAGELLERLGNKKSAIVVAALNAYISTHPDLESPHCKIEIKVGSGYSQESIKEIIRAMVEEKLKELPTGQLLACPSGKEAADLLDEDVTQMLDNLDLFQ